MFTCDAPYHNIRFYLLYLCLKLTSNSSSLVAWVVVGWSCTTFTRTVMYIHILYILHVSLYILHVSLMFTCIQKEKQIKLRKWNLTAWPEILLPLDSGSAAMILLLIRFNQFGCHGVWMQQWPKLINYLLTNLLLIWKTWIWCDELESASC